MLRWVVVAAAVVVVVNVLVAVLDAATGAPGGPASSSYATAPQGVAAYAELLARFGHDVSALRQPPHAAELSPSSTLVVLDASFLATDDVTALRRFVEAGGVVVAGGAEPQRWLEELSGDRLVWEPSAGSVHVPTGAAPQTSGVATVRSAGAGAWLDTGPAETILGPPGHALAATQTIGEGTVALLADASPLQNRLLAAADNAVFALDLAGGDGRPVEFLETVHGYGTGSGLAALPWRWRWALGGLLAALVVWVVARGRRLGFVEEASRSLPPPRSAFVDAVAATLARTRRPVDATAPLRTRVRAEIARRAGAPADASPEVLCDAAVALGLDETEARAVLWPRGGDDELLAAGRALARLERERAK